ncbi:tetratricopeptide repeat protein [Baia soyae]|uniref:Tetratricopeptide repeat protein n=1 Tax=Baia soyae TaxID=1544746 RepID=A0A4R2RNC0_9BACL|nr:tetratricopeptide repeat protein [Baia soyae]TCP61281.1 tetratricopeptide repeat protein [Baia soyae]
MADKKTRLDSEIARYVVKKNRMTKGLSLTDIDHRFPSSTASLIEKGEAVKDETFKLYLEALGITKKELKKEVGEVEEITTELRFKLKQVERMIDNGYIEIAKAELEKYQVEDFHPLAPHKYHLDGVIIQKDKSVETRKRYKRAEKVFFHAIQTCTQHNLNPDDNIIPTCYNRLAASRYFLNDLETAIDFINQGLEAYDETKDCSQLNNKYNLLANKMMYLWELSQYPQATSILYEVWPQRSKIDKNNNALLDFYKFRSIALRNQKNVQAALECCSEGIIIATNIRSDNRYLDLMIILGSIHLVEGDFTKALDRFMLVLNADGKREYPRRHIDAYTYLGILFNAKKDWLLATEYLEKAIITAQEIQDPFRLGKALITRGNVLLFQEQYTEALPYYREAESILESKNYKNRQLSALLKMIYCFDKMGTTDEFVQCLIKKYKLEDELSIKSEVEIYEVF